VRRGECGAGGPAGVSAGSERPLDGSCHLGWHLVMRRYVGLCFWCPPPSPAPRGPSVAARFAGWPVAGAWPCRSAAQRGAWRCAVCGAQTPPAIGLFPASVKPLPVRPAARRGLSAPEAPGNVKRVRWEQRLEVVTLRGLSAGTIAVPVTGGTQRAVVPRGQALC